MRDQEEKLDPMVETLLTVWALSQMRGPIPSLTRAFPPYLHSTLRRARRHEYVVYEPDTGAVYLDDTGAAYLEARGFHNAI